MKGKPIAEAIAAVLIEGFDKHYRLFRETSAQAKERFARAAWAEVQLAVLIDLYTWLLLRASPGPHWLPLPRRRQRAPWTALRATLFSAPQAAQ